MWKASLLEGVEETDCVDEGLDEILDIFSGIVEVETCSRARTDSQVPMERLSTVVT